MLQLMEYTFIDMADECEGMEDDCENPYFKMVYACEFMIEFVFSSYFIEYNQHNKDP